MISADQAALRPRVLCLCSGSQGGSMDGVKMVPLGETPRTEWQFHRTLRAFERFPRTSSKAPFGGIVASELTLPRVGKDDSELPFRGKGLRGRKPDFVSVSGSAVEVVELKLCFTEHAVRQLLNQLSRLHAAMLQGSGPRLARHMCEKILNADLSHHAADVIHAARESSLELNLPGKRLRGVLVLDAHPKEARSAGEEHRLQEWLNSGGRDPIWRLPGRRGSTYAGKASNAVPPTAEFGLLLAEQRRLVAPHKGLGIDVVTLWDPIRVGLGRDLPRLDTDLRLDLGPTPGDVHPKAPAGLVGIAALHVDSEGAQRQFTWAEP